MNLICASTPEVEVTYLQRDQKQALLRLRRDRVRVDRRCQRLASGLLQQTHPLKAWLSLSSGAKGSYARKQLVRACPRQRLQRLRIIAGSQSQ